MESVITTLVWAAILQGLFLVILYFFSRKHRSFANRLLGLFLLAIVYEATVEFLPVQQVFGYPIYYFTFPEVKLFYPVLFLHFILEKVGRTARYRKILTAHYALAFGVAGLSLVNALLVVSRGQQMVDMIGAGAVDFLFMAQQYYAFVLIAVAWVTAVREVVRYRRVVRSAYSDSDMLQINWLWRFILAVFPIILAWGADLVQIMLGSQHNSDLPLVTWGFVIVFLYFVSYQAFLHKNLFEGVPREDLPDEDHEAGKEKGRGALPPELATPEVDAQIQAIREHMELREPYLDASLSIHQLARQLDMPAQELSTIINHRLHRHFFDFVNEYRVKKAMEMLEDPENRKMTVLEILYEVGFNSKSSFNTVFKKFTGKTPTQYRKARVVSKARTSP